MSSPVEDLVLARTEIQINQALKTFPQNTLGSTSPTRPLNSSTGSAVGYGQFVPIWGPQNNTKPLPWGALSADPGLRVWAKNNSSNSPVAVILVDPIVDPFDSSIQYVSYGEMDTLMAGEERTETFRFLPISMTVTPYSPSAPSMPLIVAWQLTVDTADLGGWTVTVEAWRR